VFKKLILAGALVAIGYSSLSAQSAPAQRKKSVPDFDIREVSATPDLSAGQNDSRAIVERRRATLEAFASAPEETKAGTRITPNQFGLPKLFRRDGHALSPPSTLPAADIAKTFLRSRSDLFALSDSEIDSLRLLVDDASGNARFVALNQTVNGVDVFNAQIKFTLNKDGELIQIAAGDVVPGLTLSPIPRLNSEEGVKAAFSGVGSPLTSRLSAMPRSDGKVAFANPRGNKYSPITAETVIFPMNASSARLA